MLEKMKSAWRIPELRKKIIYTFGMLLIYRLLCVIPVPGINVSAVASAVKDYSILDFMNMMTGGSFQNMSIMAMGITPYINSSIILQLLTVAIPALEKLANEGPEGRKKINEYTRYLTVVLAFIQAVGLVFAMRANSYGGVWYLVIGLSMAAGSALAMWIGERITENGIGNGISLLIMAGIVSNMFNWGRQADGWHGGRHGAPDRGDRDRDRAAGDDRGHHLCGHGRAPHPDPVRQARGGPQDVRRSVHLHPDEN